MVLNHLTIFSKGTINSSYKIIFILMIGLITNASFSQNFSGQKIGENEINQTEEERLIGLGKMFVEILNAPTDDMAEKFASIVYIPEKAEGLASLLRKQFGKIEVGTIRLMPNNLAIHIVAKVIKTDKWMNFQIGLTKSEPKMGTGLFVGLASAPFIIPPGKISDTNVLKKLNEYIDQLAKKNDISGSILIAKGEKIIIERAYGLANKETGRKNNKTTPFSLASGGKMFTAVAILKLIQEGKISLNDPVIKFLPDYPNKEFANKATISHLLSHSSGLGDFWDDEYERQSSKIKTLKDYIPFITNKPLRFDSPGKQGSYSNSGFILLGLIIENVTGVDYFSYIKKVIFDPLEMKNTGFYRRNQENTIAIGYNLLGKKADNVQTELIGSSAGGALSTAADMLKFKTAMVNNRLLNKELTNLAINKQAILDSGRLVYGYGFVISEGNDPSFGHGGMYPGGTFVFNAYKKTDYTLIIFSNQISGGGSELQFTVSKVLSR